jgi:hypothetical protein
VRFSPSIYFFVFVLCEKGRCGELGARYRRNAFFSFYFVFAGCVRLSARAILSLPDGYLVPSLLFPADLHVLRPRRARHLESRSHTSRISAGISIQKMRAMHLSVVSHSTSCLCASPVRQTLLRTLICFFLSSLRLVSTLAKGIVQRAEGLGSVRSSLVPF